MARVKSPLLIAGDTLRSLHAFSTLTDRERDALIRCFVITELRSGELVPLNDDNSPLCLGLVISGAVVWQREREIENLWPGSAFGELSADHCMDGALRLQARGSTTVALLSRRECEGFLAGNPGAGMSIMRALACAFPPRSLERQAIGVPLVRE